MDSYSTAIIKAWLKSKGKSDLEAYRILKDLKQYCTKAPPPEPLFSSDDIKPKYDKTIKWKKKTVRELKSLEKDLIK